MILCHSAPGDSSIGCTVPREETSLGVVRDLEGLVKQHPVLTRGWRAVPLIVCTVAIVLPLALETVDHMIGGNRQSAPLDERVSRAALSELVLADHGSIRMSAADRQAIEAALATRYRDVLADGRLFRSAPEAGTTFARDQQAIARELLRRYPDAPRDVASPTAPRVDAIISRVSTQDGLPWHQTFYKQMFGLYMGAAVIALILNFAFWGGFMRTMGLELVTADGRLASRLRVLVRTAVTWSPIFVVPIVMPFVERALPGLALDLLVDSPASSRRHRDPSHAFSRRPGPYCSDVGPCPDSQTRASASYLNRWWHSWSGCLR